MQEILKRKIELEQRSPAWYEMRSRSIGASDAAIISGLSPWKSAIALYMEKTGAIQQPDLSQNFAVQRGVRLEPMVCGMVNLLLDRDFEPATFVSAERPHIIASLDCFDPNHMEIGEIKVGGQADHKKLYTAEESTPQRIIIPKKYYAQVMQQMYVLDRDWSYFISYYLPKGDEDHKGDLRIVKVHRDQRFLDQYLPVADAFHHAITNKTPPETVKLVL